MAVASCCRAQRSRRRGRMSEGQRVRQRETEGDGERVLCIEEGNRAPVIKASHAASSDLCVQLGPVLQHYPRCRKTETCVAFRLLLRM